MTGECSGWETHGGAAGMIAGSLGGVVAVPRLSGGAGSADVVVVAGAGGGTGIVAGGARAVAMVGWAGMGAGGVRAVGVVVAARLVGAGRVVEVGVGPVAG
ncbi:hypothetical protein JCM33774_52240 [Actinophytocola sp. KF-1]